MQDSKKKYRLSLLISRGEKETHNCPSSVLSWSNSPNYPFKSFI